LAGIDPLIFPDNFSHCFWQIYLVFRHCTTNLRHEGNAPFGQEYEGVFFDSILFEVVLSDPAFAAVNCLILQLMVWEAS
jgi:hypothetical protein